LSVMPVRVTLNAASFSLTAPRSAPRADKIR
jgi:hypothetical protein